jgi:hypothetical protein
MLLMVKSLQFLCIRQFMQYVLAEHVFETFYTNIDTNVPVVFEKTYQT